MIRFSAKHYLIYCFKMNCTAIELYNKHYLRLILKLKSRSNDFNINNLVIKKLKKKE